MTNPQPSPTGLRPVASPAARWLVMLLGVLFLVVAFATGREIWVRHFATGYRSWAEPFTNYIGNLSYQTWMLVAGIICLIIGLLLLIPVFIPRTPTHVRISSDANVWMRPIDIARMVTANAEKVAGVKRAHTEVSKLSKSAVTLTVDTDGEDPTLVSRLGRAVGPLVGRVASDPQLVIKVNEPEEDNS